MSDNRRSFIKKSVSLAAGVSLVGITASCGESEKSDSSTDNAEPAKKADVRWPIKKGANTPKLCMGASRDSDGGAMRKIKQIGIDNVLMGGPPIPWTEKSLESIMNSFAKEGLTVINMMIGGHPKTIYGREGREQEIEQIKQSLVAAGKVGLAVVEYNFYAHRLMEGYYEKKGRGGAGMTAFDYEPVKDLPAKPEIGEHRAENLWKNLEYFLKEVIPVADKAGVRMALHPNDPPITVSHGSDQIMRTLTDWKRLIEIVDSPSNGITYDCGVTRELGENPLEVLEYFGSRDRINHVHYRNVISEVPYNKYTEVFLDEGQIDMYAIMRDLIAMGYSHGLYPEHPRALDYDKEHKEGIQNQYPGGGGYTGMTYNIAFTKAMKLAVLSSK